MREKNLNFDRGKIFKFFQEKKYEKISKLSKSILRTFNNDQEVYKIVIFSELNVKNFHKATAISEKLLSLYDNAETNYVYGNVLKLQNKFKESIKYFEKAVEFKKDYFEAYNNLATSQKNLGLIDDAFKNYKIAIKIKDNNLEAHYNLANLLYAEKKYDEALSNYEKVIKINENFPQSYLLIGLIKSVQGKFDDAKSYFLKAIEKDKFLSEAYVYYVSTRKVNKDDDIIKALEELIKDENLHPKYIQDFSFALSKVYFDIDNIDLGFKFLKKAKKTYLKKIEFSIDKEKDHLKKVVDYFSKNNIPKLEIENSHELKPIFIVGMPRSGTSLIEQILSTHSMIHGAGELKYLPEIIYDNKWNIDTDVNELLKLIRSKYLSQLEKLNQSKKYIVDKMPFNFFSIGFILNAIPEAKIIHMSRNPMAVCWSNYKANFFDNEGMDYAHKLETIGQYYLIYNHMIEFWRSKYQENIIEINYDNFVLDYEENSKNLIKKIGLKWEDKILKFYENNRGVETNSLLQVRSKVYKNSSKQWKKYEKHLTPIIDILKENNINF